jgi:hypothetical protein
MATFVVIDASGNVINSIVLEPGDQWQPPPDTTAVQNDFAGIGWTFLDGIFTPPPQPTPPPHVARINELNSDPDLVELVERLTSATPEQMKRYADENFPSLTSGERLIIAKILLSLASRY